MKKIIVLLMIGIVAIASITAFHRQSENIVQAESQDQNHSASRILPQNENETFSLPIENTAPASNKNIDILLVNADNPLAQNYQPVELINLFKQRGRKFQLARSDIEICRIVYEAMQNMFTAAKNDGVDGFIITSGYRSHDEQAAIYANTTNGTAALPGTSEHQTGLAFDVTAYGNGNFELTPQFEWLSKHCGEYGFILRYPKGKEDITGFPYEPWHYRYVGLPYSKEIMDEGITLEEYLERN
jgi:D-alanyl-D-alanine carboxypeptidase